MCKAWRDEDSAEHHSEELVGLDDKRIKWVLFDCRWARLFSMRAGDMCLDHDTSSAYVWVVLVANEHDLDQADLRIGLE